MKTSKEVALCVWSAFLFNCAKCLVVLSGCNQELCLNDPAIEYQYRCTVNESNTLRWRIFRNASVQSLLDTESYTNGDNLAEFVEFEDAPQFSSDFTANSPSLVSNISFTAQSSVDGFVTVCEDADGNSMNCTIHLTGFLSPPMDITVSGTQDLRAIVSWSSPVLSSCFVEYTVQSNATNGPLITTTDTSIPMLLDGLSAGFYCVSVAAVDTANRIGMYSENKCFELSVSENPNITSAVVSYIESSSRVLLSLSWKFISSSTDILPLTAVYISYVSTDSGQPSTIKLQATEVTSNLPVEEGLNYTITVFGENSLGNGSTTTIDVSIPVFNASTSPTDTPTSSTNQVTRIAVGIVVPLVFLTILLVTTIVVIAIFAHSKASRKRITTNIDKLKVIKVPKHFFFMKFNNNSPIPPQATILTQEEGEEKEKNPSKS